MKNSKCINCYIVYEIHLWNRGYDDYPTLENSSFGAFKLVTNADIDKYKYSWYGIGFDSRGTSPVATRFGRNLIIFGVDISSSVHLDKNKKLFLFFVKVSHKE